MKKYLSWRWWRNKFWWPVLWKYCDTRHKLYRKLTYKHIWNYSYKTFRPGERYSIDCTVYVTERKWIWKK